MLGTLTLLIVALAGFYFVTLSFISIAGPTRASSFLMGFASTAGLFMVPWRSHRAFVLRAVPQALRHLRLVALASLLLGAFVLWSAFRAAAYTQASDRKQNMELAWSLHSPAHQLIARAGKTFNRESHLNAIAGGALRHVRWEPGATHVRASSSLAVVRYRAQLEVPSGTTVTCWHTDSCELRDELWQAGWPQATAIPSPPQDVTGGDGAV